MGRRGRFDGERDKTFCTLFGGPQCSRCLCSTHAFFPSCTPSFFWLPDVPTRGHAEARAVRQRQQRRRSEPVDVGMKTAGGVFQPPLRRRARTKEGVSNTRAKRERGRGLTVLTSKGGTIVQGEHITSWDAKKSRVLFVKEDGDRKEGGWGSVSGGISGQVKKRKEPES